VGTLRARRRLKPELQTLLGDAGLVVADAGAAYGLPAHLAVLDSVATVCFFEPHPERARELTEIYEQQGRGADVRVSQAALSACGGERTLYVTNIPTGSSLLKPGSQAAIEWVNPDYFFPVREELVQTRRLEDALLEESISRLDFIKIDVQGAELEVLHGLGKLADEILGVELEIGYPGGYEDQPGFCQLKDYLESIGLELFDLKPVRGHRHLRGARLGYPEDVFGVVPDSPSLSERLWETDAVYFRSAKAVLEKKDLPSVRRLVLLYCAYGFFVEAHSLISRAEAIGFLPPEEASVLKSSVIVWHRKGHYRFTYSVAWRRYADAIVSIPKRVLNKIFGRRLGRWLE
jgi:FkbM family methyltransferase